MKNNLGRYKFMDIVYIWVKSFKFETAADFHNNIKMVINSYGPVLIDVIVTENENCYPMVAPGKNNAQMIGIFKRKIILVLIKLTSGIIPKKYNIFGCPSPHSPNECFKISIILFFCNKDTNF